MANTCLSGALVLVSTLAVAACSSSSGGTSTGTDGGKHDSTAPRPDAASHPDASKHDAKSGDGGKKPTDAGSPDAPSDAAAPAIDAASCSGGCPTGYTCTSANGLPVCRAPSGVPLFTHVFVILEENTSLSTLEASITANAAPNFASLQSKYASATEYHGVAHPSLPNYIALTSGGTQGIKCDGLAQADAGACTSSNCNLLSGSCSCVESVTNLADQLETANKTWSAFGEDMGTPCNLVSDDDGGVHYAVRHVPFLYYTDIQSNAARCAAHVVDYSTFDPASAPDFTYIAPNLLDDMHDPFPATQGNITTGDTWIGPVAAKIMASSAYTDGGLFVIVWDEDDDSGIIAANAPIPIFVMSPYAKSGGYMSAATFDHYSLLATIEDGMNLPRLGSAGTPRPSTADTLADFFAKE